MTRGWASSAPPSPLVPPDHEQYATYDPDLRPCEDDEDGTDWRALASPGILSVADDCALCGVDLDVSCLDALDEQLLLSPVACFTELCWAAAVCDDATAPVLHRHTRARVRSFKGASERPAPPCPREYPGSFERCRPLAARIVVPIDRVRIYLSCGFAVRLTPDASQSPCYPLSAPCASDATFAVFQDKKARAYFPDADARGLPVQGVPMPRRVKKRAPMAEPRASSQPATPIKSSHTLRVITDAYSTLTRARRRSPHKVV